MDDRPMGSEPAATRALRGNSVFVRRFAVVQRYELGRTTDGDDDDDA